MEKHRNLIFIFGAVLFVFGLGILFFSYRTTRLKQEIESSPASSTLEYNQPSTKEALFIYEAVNKEREAAGLPLYKYDSRLEYTAVAKACDIEEKGYWSHTAPDGTTFSQFMRARGAHEFKELGENLGTRGTPEELMKLWMDSPTHRRNILEPAFTSTGVGICGETTAQHFGQL